MTSICFEISPNETSIIIIWCYFTHPFQNTESHEPVLGYDEKHYPVYSYMKKAVSQTNIRSTRTRNNTLVGSLPCHQSWIISYVTFRSRFTSLINLGCFRKYFHCSGFQIKFRI